MGLDKNALTVKLGPVATEPKVRFSIAEAAITAHGSAAGAFMRDSERVTAAIDALACLVTGRADFYSLGGSALPPGDPHLSRPPRSDI